MGNVGVAGKFSSVYFPRTFHIIYLVKLLVDQWLHEFANYFHVIALHSVAYY